MWKKILTDYFSFNAAERRAVIVLVVFILAFAFLPSLFPQFLKPSSVISDSLKKEIAALKITGDPADTGNFYPQKKTATENNDPAGNRYVKEEKNSYPLFYFDPNTLDADGWKKLGISERTIRTIMNYRNKGGLFRRPEDIGKIYGLNSEEYERIVPYIKTGMKPGNPDQQSPGKKNIPVTDVQELMTDEINPVHSIIDINAADSIALISLPGIGNYLARKIISFRDKLGGFYSIDQVADVYNLPDSTFQLIRSYLVLRTPVYRQININTAGLDELRAHPYIRYQLAKAILEYRESYGNFSSVEGIRKIQLVTDEIYAKLAPYLRTN